MGIFLLGGLIELIERGILKLRREVKGRKRSAATRAGEEKGDKQFYIDRIPYRLL